MAKPLDTFIKNLNDINETDYGDFMRKANNYLNLLNDEIYDSSNVRVQRMLNEVKRDIQYYPNWDVASTKNRTLLMINKIKENYKQ